MGGRKRVRSLAVCWVTATIATAVFVPMADAEWLPPVDISEPGEAAGNPHVVLDSEGNATAVWDRWNGTDTVVESAFRPAGEGWGTPQDLSEPELEGETVPGSNDADSPQIAVDRNGNVTVLWERYAGAKIVLQSVDRPLGGSWSAPADIAEVSQGASPEPWIAVDWEGNATAVWKQDEVIQSSFRPFAGSWGEPTPISGPESFVPQAAMDARGDTTAVWMHFDGTHYVVESAYKPEQGEWEAPTLVSQPGEEGGNPHVALDALGDSLVVWRGEDEGDEFVRAAYRPEGGSWGPATNVSSPGEHVEALRDALDSEGNAIVAWSGDMGKEGEYGIAHAAYKPAAGEWQPPTALSTDGGNAFPSDVVFDTGGNAALVWQRWDGSSNVVQAAYRPAGGEWEAAVDLSEEGAQGMDAVVVLDAPGDATAADGHATAVWVSETTAACEGKAGSCPSDVVQAAGYDPNGMPEIELEVPTEGTVDEPVEISTPTEGLFAPLLEFGDGKSATDVEAVHVYDEPGEYEVSLEAAEVLGYRAGARETIVIAAAGPAGGSDPETESPSADPGPASREGRLPPTPGVVVDPGNTALSGECIAAQEARAFALRRLRVAAAKLGRARGAEETRPLARAKRKRAAALARASRRVAGAC
jgi:PKD domain